jgi:glucose-1-phosphate adenylyltransferase
VRIEAGARLEGCVIFDGVHIGAKAKLRRVIADRFNVISAGTEMGYDRAEDRKRGHITKSGLVVLPRGHAARGVTKPAHPA